MRAGQHPPADSEDHRPVPMHQGRERILGIVPGPPQEKVQQLGIGQPTERTRAS